MFFINTFSRKKIIFRLFKLRKNSGVIPFDFPSKFSKQSNNTKISFKYFEITGCNVRHIAYPVKKHYICYAQQNLYNARKGDL